MDYQNLTSNNDENSNWIDDLINWADRNNIPELQHIYDNSLGFEISFWVGLPRDRHLLLNLKELDLSWHSCTEIPEQIRYLKNLKSLSFSKSKTGLQQPFYENANNPGSLKEIPTWISELENLEELDLSGNEILFVPESISKLSKLKKLYLQNNHIIFISPEFSQIKSLETLWIQGNYFNVLNEVLEKFDDCIKENIDSENKIEKLRLILHQACIEKLTQKTVENSLTKKITILLDGLKQLKNILKAENEGQLWDQWKKYTDYKKTTSSLYNLIEFHCD